MLTQSTEAEAEAEEAGGGQKGLQNWEGMAETERKRKCPGK